MVTKISVFFSIFHLAILSVLGQNYVNVSLKSSITQVNPGIGLVFWPYTDWTNALNGTKDDPYTAYSLEYFNVPIDQIVVGRVNGTLQYDWSYIEDNLNWTASHGHQAIFLPYYEYFPGTGIPTACPAFLKTIRGYQGEVLIVQLTNGTNGNDTFEFMDWRSNDLMQMHLDLWTALAQKYDGDNRIFAIQSGFGFWSEYHIWSQYLDDGLSPPYGYNLSLGYNFPSSAFQVQSIKHILSVFKTTPIQYSKDMADVGSGWFPAFPSIANLSYGALNDVAFAKDYENGSYVAIDMANMNWFTRYRNNPLGGEIAYYVNSNGVSIQEHALDINGPEGQSLPDNVTEYKYTYLVAGNQPDYHYDGPLTQLQRIRQVGQTFGYKFTVTAFQTNGTNTKATIKNTGVAPPYYDMHIQINGVTGVSTTLKGLQPGNSWTYTVPHPNTTKPTLKIVSPHILSNQTIQYEANL